MNLFKAFEDFHNEEQRKRRHEAEAATNQIKADLSAQRFRNGVEWNIQQKLKQLRNKQMTREEALKKIEKRSYTDNFSGAELFLNRLEALGLIKFDEPKKYGIHYQDLFVEVPTTLLNHPGLSSIVKELYSNGYRIIKDDKYSVCAECGLEIKLNDTAKGSSK